MRAVGVMNASWVGQSFVLSSCNDPRPPPLAKKSRNRRTKEVWERMVESFIKKYQNLNNGNLPSLNLTHKNVGGSFYTVREVFRKIVIQETMGLGPSNNLNDEYAEESSHCIDNLSNLSLSVNTHSIEEVVVVVEEEEEEKEKGNLQEISTCSNQVISMSSSHEDLQRDDTSRTTQHDEVDAEENNKCWKGENSLEVLEADRLMRVRSRHASVGDLHKVQAVDSNKHNMGDEKKSIPLLDGMSRKHLKEALKRDKASESNPITMVASAINGFFASFVKFFIEFKVK